MVLDFDHFSMALIVFIANKITADTSSFFRKHLGIGATEWRVMALLAAEPWSPAKRICDVIKLDRAIVSRTVHTLRDRQLVQARQRGSNSRSPQLALTDHGWQLHNRMIEVQLERERRLLSCLDKAERVSFLDMLGRVQRSLEQSGPEISVPPE